MEVILYENFKKRRNSTKQPSDQGIVLDVKLKAPTDMDKPTFLIDGDINTNVSYAKFNNAYFYIDSIRSINNKVWEVSLSMDELATYKTDIANTNAFIIYSSTGYNRNIIDNRISAKVTKQIDYNTSNMGSLFEANGCYILSVANRHNSGNGMSCQYVLDKDQIDGFANSLMNPNLYEQISQFFNGSPMQSIISCTWMPINFNVAKGSTLAPIEFGGATFENLYSILKLETSTIAHDDTIAIPWRYNDFRRSQPYTSMSLVIPFYGMIDINPSDLIGYNNLWYRYTIDIGSGDVNLVLRTGDSTGKIISVLNFNIGVACPIAQTSSNMGGVAGGTAGALAGLGTFAVGVMSENAIAALGGLGAVAMSASNAALSYNTRSTSVRGSINGRAIRNLGFSMILSAYAMDTEDPDENSFIATHGRPVMHKGLINDYAGFIQCDGASVSISGLRSEADSINAVLNSGFYFE